MSGPVPSFESPGAAVAWPDSFGARLGLLLIGADRGLVRARLPLLDGVRGIDGALHPGVCASVADTLAGYGTRWGGGEPSVHAVGRSTTTTVLTPVTEGWVHATAELRHGGQAAWLWDVELRDDTDRLVALARVSVPLRPVV